MSHHLEIRVNRDAATVEVGSNPGGGIGTFQSHETLSPTEAAFWARRLHEAGIVAAKLALASHRAKGEFHAAEAAELQDFLTKNGVEP